MKKLLASILFLVCNIGCTSAQEYFTIDQYDVNVKINKNASLDIVEKISVHFTEPRHGIIRKIPYKYKIQALPSGIERANLPMQSGGYNHTIVKDIRVPGWEYDVSNDGDYKSIKIGSANKTVEGNQQYIITYHILNAINFFKDHSEFYSNIIGHQWSTTIASVNFTIEIPEPLFDTSNYFVATGITGSGENITVTKWTTIKYFQVKLLSN